MLSICATSLTRKLLTVIKVLKMWEDKEFGKRCSPKLSTSAAKMELCMKGAGNQERAQNFILKPFRKTTFEKVPQHRLIAFLRDPPMPPTHL